MGDAGPEEQDRIEFSDLPGEGVGYQRYFGDRKIRRRVGVGLSVLTVILGLLLFNVAGGSTLLVNLIRERTQRVTGSQKKEVLSVGFIKVVDAEQQLGAISNYEVSQEPPGVAPKSCLKEDQVDSKRTIGAPPIWLSGFEGPNARLQLMPLKELQIPGDETKVLPMWGARVRITLEPGFGQPVTLGLLPEQNGQPPSFGLQIVSGPVASGVGKYHMTLFLPAPVMLDPKNPEQTDNEISYMGGNVWEISIYVFEAGCYSLDADWGSSGQGNGGHWQVSFAAGQ
jgi:hypothetical protein